MTGTVNVIFNFPYCTFSFNMAWTLLSPVRTDWLLRSFAFARSVAWCFTFAQRYI